MYPAFFFASSKFSVQAGDFEETKKDNQIMTPKFFILGQGIDRAPKYLVQGVQAYAIPYRLQIPDYHRDCLPWLEGCRSRQLETGAAEVLVAIRRGRHIHREH